MNTTFTRREVFNACLGNTQFLIHGACLVLQVVLFFLCGIGDNNTFLLIWCPLCVLWAGFWMDYNYGLVLKELEDGVKCKN